MSIYKINTKNTINRKIEAINDMVKEVNGKVEKGKFDENEISQLAIDSGVDRKYIRNVILGHTTSNYTDWSHLQSEVGYSIWKLTPTSYTYDAVNNLYFDEIKLDNRGSANAESATSFDYVYFYEGDSGAGYTDNTTEAGTESGTEFNSLDSSNDYLYVGEGATFSGVKFEFHTKGSNYTNVIEYWDSSAWITLTANTNNLVDNTSNFESDGTITYTTPPDWTANSVNSQTKFWLRFSTSTTPSTTAKIYLVIPGTSVIGLLGMSATQIQEEDWAWCSYSGAIYVTIRNEGNSSYEGNAFIKSGSSVTNLQNFFVYNHEYTLDHKDSTYDAVKTITSNTTLTGGEGVVLISLTSSSVIATLPTASGNEGLKIIIKAIDFGSGNTGNLDAYHQETIDGMAGYIFTSDNESITIVSDGANWQIIGGYKE